MKRWIGLVLVLVPFLASAANFWDGNAALQRGDAAFEGGMFAASNSFAPDTQIVVQNLETGKTAAVTVTKRMDGQSDILVLLSPTAASALGISAGTLASVRVTVPPRTADAASSLPSEQTFSPDPDLNPAASYSTAAAKPEATTQVPETPAESQTTAASAVPEATTEQAIPTAAEPATEAAAAPTVTAPEEPSPSEESLPGTAAPAVAMAPETNPASAPEAPAPEQAASPPSQETTPPQTTPAETPTTSGAGTEAQTAQAAAAEAARKAAEDAAILSEAESRTPQKQVFLPPREDKTFAYHPPAAPPVQTAEAAPAETTPPVQAVPAEPQITAVIGEPEAAPAVVPEENVQLAEAAAPQESLPQEIVSTDTGAPAPEAGSASVALASPEPVPEEAPPQAAPAPVQTEVTGPAATPPAQPPAAEVALAAPEAPAPPQVPAQQSAAASSSAPTTGQAPSTTVAVASLPQERTMPATPAPQAAAPAKQSTGDTYYVQLAAYSTEKGARDLAATLAPTYPALVMAPAAPGSRMFRVVIGPLNKAESGTLLVWFRFRGFPDAFLKQE